jgi:hypothetical protein
MGHVSASPRLAAHQSGRAIAADASKFANQQEHHRKKTFPQEFQLFVKRYGLK